MRSSVDLPQPEGPTSTQNSPSAMSSSTPCTTAVEPKDLCTPLSVTAAMLFPRLLPVLAVALLGHVHVPAHRARAPPPGRARGSRSSTASCSSMVSAGHRRVFELRFQRAVERPDALVPQRLHHQFQRAVAGCLRDARRGRRGPRRAGCGAAWLPSAGRRAPCGWRAAGRRLPFFAASAAHSPSIIQRARITSNGPEAPASSAPRPRSSGWRDVDARADAHVEQAFDFERDQRFAQAGPRYAELAREVAFRRQARAGRHFAVADQRADLVGDLAIETTRLDGLQAHARCFYGGRETAGARAGYRRGWMIGQVVRPIISARCGCCTAPAGYAQTRGL